MKKRHAENTVMNLKTSPSLTDVKFGINRRLPMKTSLCLKAGKSSSSMTNKYTEYEVMMKKFFFINDDIGHINF